MFALATSIAAGPLAPTVNSVARTVIDGAACVVPLGSTIVAVVPCSKIAVARRVPRASDTHQFFRCVDRTGSPPLGCDANSTIGFHDAAREPDVDLRVGARRQEKTMSIANNLLNLVTGAQSARSRMSGLECTP